jgi:hypothetical protein
MQRENKMISYKFLASRHFACVAITAVAASNTVRSQKPPWNVSTPLSPYAQSHSICFPIPRSLGTSSVEEADFT